LGVSIVPVTRVKESTELKKEIMALKWRNNLNQALNKKMKKSGTEKKVEEIENNHQMHRRIALKSIKKQQTTRRSSLQLRVQARNKSKHTNVLLKSECFSNTDPISISKIIDAMDFIAIKENNYEMCRQGEVAGILYIIVSGTCQVTIDGKAIAVLGESDIFGENSFFADVNGVSRNEVTVTTINNEIGNVQVLALPRVKFNKLLAAGTLTEDFEKKLKEVAKKRKQVLRQGQVA
jgi:CRP-like cAMP-binding protein